MRAAAAALPAGARGGARRIALSRSAPRRCCSPARCSSARGIGSEFMPPLNEGDLMFMPIADPSISLEENTKIAAKQNAVADDVSRGRVRRRQGRARGHLHRSGAAEHDRDDRPPEAAGPVAAGHDARSAAGRDGPRGAAAGRLEHLDDADHQPDRHADDRHPVRSRREDLRHRSAGARRRSRDASPMSSGRCRARATSIPSR